MRPRGNAESGRPTPSRLHNDAANAALGHRDCLGVYFRQAKLLWGSGTLTRRDRALLDQLRVGLRLTITEAAKLESAAARVEATAEELAAQESAQLVQPLARPGPWL